MQRLNWLLLILGLAAAAWLVVRAQQHHRAGPAAPRALRELELTDAVPLGPSVLVTLDVTALGPRAKQQLLEVGAKGLLGLRELCGFEPLLGVRKVALAVPTHGAEDSPDFALIADTTLEPEAVLRCAEAAIRKRGGTPARSKLGNFDSVRSLAKPLGEVATRDDGLFVMSGGQYFRAVIDAASGVRGGDEAARLRTALHESVRRKLGAEPLLLSALPGDLSLPGVKMIGVGLNLEQGTLRGVLYCPSAAECGQARESLQRLVLVAADEPELSALSRMKIEQREAELEVTGPLTLEQLGNFATLLAP